jgi:hypothetical protein
VSTEQAAWGAIARAAAHGPAGFALPGPLPEVRIIARMVAAERVLCRSAMESEPAEALAAIRNARMLRDRSRRLGASLAPKVEGEPPWRLP